VRIDDFAEPRFAPHVAALMASMGPIAESVRLSPDALIEQARAETGLDDLGDDHFREPLAVICEALRTEANLSPMGKVSTQSQLVALLRNRLLVQELLTRHPEIGDLLVERPIIIAGLPRTGTTHLHNLISADPALRSLPYWESLQPVLPADQVPGSGQPDPRLAATEAGLSMIEDAAPYFKRMHEMTTSHVHEEIQLLGMTFSTMLFETMAVMPSYRDWYKATDQTPAYAYLRTVLQALQWTRGGTRWVLKSPQNMEQFAAIRTVFPDATVAVTHRDPVSVTASLAVMMTYLARLSVERPDPSTIGRYWADRVEDLLGACLRDRDLLGTGPSIDVRFHELMADDLAMVERIYAVAGQPLTATARSSMAAFVAEHPRGRYGRVHYDLADFDLHATTLRKATRTYVERFGVKEEELNQR
jgi:hypothetical protein